MLTLPATSEAQPRTEFSVCWSIYVGWMPWGWIEESGLMDEWEAKYGISVEIVQINDYIESINQYTATSPTAMTASSSRTPPSFRPSSARR
jgi:NitT/TauT family transport system substrate-binding protein